MLNISLLLYLSSSDRLSQDSPHRPLTQNLSASASQRLGLQQCAPPIWLSQVDHIGEIVRFLSFCLWLMLVHATSTRFGNMTEGASFLRRSSPLYQMHCLLFIIPPSIDTWFLSTFRLLWTMLPQTTWVHTFIFRDFLWFFYFQKQNCNIIHVF